MLELQQFAIVDSLALELSAGLNVLTGETGAGKSILIDALSLLCGERADSGYIRAGSDSALIQAVFSGVGIDSAARRLVANGRSSARLNGELVTVGELAERLGGLMAIYGQHAAQLLTSAQAQRQLLDGQLPAAARALLVRYQAEYAAWQRATRELEALRQASRERARRLDVLNYQLAEIDAAQLQPGELEALREELSRLRHAERIAQGGASALAQLSEAEVNAVALLASAARELEAVGRYSRELEALAAELREALASVEATLRELESFLADIEAQPARLEALEARLAQIEQLSRKYGEGVEGILRYREAAAAELAQLSGAEENMAALEAEQQARREVLEALASELMAARQAVAEQLSAAVSAKLKPLGMPHATFKIALSPAEQLGPQGRDALAFYFSANLGEPLAPLNAVASGGELSRVMLALHAVTGSELPILVFDEVDAGIGGKTARAVGRLLKQLAQRHQVLVVTHLPQVAAFADSQFLVEKREQEGRTITTVRRLSEAERELELARMLSGAVTEAAIANARELLREARAAA